MLFLLLIAQSAAAPLADIQLDARVEARSVRVESEGRATLRASASPDLDSTTKVMVDPPVPNGKTVKNLRARVRAEARIADPSDTPKPPATGD